MRLFGEKSNARVGGYMSMWSVMLFLVLHLQVVTCIRAGNKVREAPKQAASPFVDILPERPPFKPMAKPPPYNIFEIPELPSRFQSKLIHSKPSGEKVLGRIVYDYIIRKTLIQYNLAPSPAVESIYMDYQVLTEKLFHHIGPGTPQGEKCTLFELAKPYNRMFSPRSWRKIDVESIDMEGLSWMESQRQNGYVSVVGHFDNYFMAGHIYSNGTLKQVTVGRDRWDFFDFEDLSALDQKAIDDHPGLNDLRQPMAVCDAGGPLTIESATRLNHLVPWTLFKPSQTPARRNDRGENVSPAEQRAQRLNERQRQQRASAKR